MASHKLQRDPLDGTNLENRLTPSVPDVCAVRGAQFAIWTSPVRVHEEARSTRRIAIDDVALVAPLRDADADWALLFGCRRCFR